MKLYRITTLTKLGSDTVLALDADQMAHRGHRVHVIETSGKDGGRTVVRPNEPLDFKVGETVGIVGTVPKYLMDKVEPVGEAPDPQVEIATADQRRDEIIAAIELLDPKNRKHFTRDGTPSVKAIEGVLKYDISQAERDAAWTIVFDRREAEARKGR